MQDPYNLQRFVDAQAPVIESVRSDLKQGRKRGHWMWFVFPQLRGLGQSPTSYHFGISGLQEASAYLEHDVLGPRLIECTQLVTAVHHRSAEDIFGEIDALKFRSSITLFSKAAPAEHVFNEALEKYFNAEPDPSTDRLLR